MPDSYIRDPVTGQEKRVIDGDCEIRGQMDITGPLRNYGQPVGGGSELPYTTYVALLTQSDTDAPVATVLENTIGEIVWARGATGVYTATLANAFPIGKTVVLIGTNLIQSEVWFIGYLFGGASAITFRTFGSALDASDDLMIRTSIEIRVYP